MDRRYNLVLLLIMTSLVFWGPTAKASVLGTAANVKGWKGEDIRLLCDIQEEPRLVLWVKQSISNQQILKARYFDGHFESLEERFDIDKNFSLDITDLEVADEGLYYCQGELIDYQVFENFTILTVDSMASKHEIEECVDKSPSNQSICTYHIPFNTLSINLTCVVSGFKPNISMLWTNESGKRLDSVVSQQTTLSDDTYERMEVTTVSAIQGIEQTFLCTATGDSLNGTSTAGITLLPIPGKRNKLGQTIGLAMFASVAVVVLFLLAGMLLQKYQSQILRKVCGCIPCFRQHQRQRNEDEGLMIGSPSHLFLTEEQVQQCKNDLKVYYRQTYRKVSVDPLDFMKSATLDDIYTNVSLVNENGMRKTAITYADLFTTKDRGDLSKRLLIQGEGGVGKTTLCAKIALDWCDGKILQNLDLLIVIPLRHVTVSKTIGGIMDAYLSQSNEATTSQIDHYISTHLSKIFLVLDGFDEFSEEMEEGSNSEVIRILRLEQYESCKAIVTSRPWRTGKFTSDRSIARAYTFISIEGFSKENIPTYIKKYFRIKQNKDHGDNLVSFMEENDAIRGHMSPFPIYCAMLCLMWEESNEERQKAIQNMQTFSQIVGEMISFLKEHYASKFCDNLQEDNPMFYVKEAGTAIQVIREIAMDGLLGKKLSFPKEHFKNCDEAMEICVKVGVLTIEEATMRRRRRHDANISSFLESKVSFTHRLFQDFVAGACIANLFANDRTRYDKVKEKLLSRYEEFRYVLYFATSSEKEVGIDIITGLSKCADQNFCVDVAFECHFEDACRGLEKKWTEYTLSGNMSEHTKSGIVFVVHSNRAKSLTVDNVDCGRTLSSDLAEGMCSSSVLHKVDLKIRNLQLDNTFYEIISANASNCQIQDLLLDVKRLDQSSVGENLARCVCNMPNLSRCRLICDHFPENFLPTAAALASSCQIRCLTISRDTRGGAAQNQSSVGGDMAKLMRTMPYLADFGLKGFQLSDEFFSTTANSAASCQIRSLSLEIGVGNSGQSSATETHLVEILCRMPKLGRADLTWQDVPISFLVEIAKKVAKSKLDGITINTEAFNKLLRKNELLVRNSMRKENKEEIKEPEQATRSVLSEEVYSSQTDLERADMGRGQEDMHLENKE
ncbi:uncharacterized protein [Diadema antillarum]|uniref:uncharacterized protein isoform X2 n=1 Tax=Diadema antillarum TaxID=105358 RepID=UPI003A89F121